jgi:hypothetical protein
MSWYNLISRAKLIDLIRHLHEALFCEALWISGKLRELDDSSATRDSPRIFEAPSIAIQRFYRRKIRFSNANDHYTEWSVSPRDDRVDCILHVAYCPMRQNEQNCVSPPPLEGRRRALNRGVDDRRKIRWRRELDLWERAPIHIEYSLEAIDIRIV